MARGTEEGGIAKRLDGRRSGARGTARERLLDAATKLFATRGYSSASVEAITEEAGLTKGALYWNFQSKEDLLLTLLDERFDRRTQALSDVLKTATREEDTALPVSQGFAAVIDERRELFLLSYEYWSLAVRDPSMRERYVMRQRSLRDGLATAIAARHQTLEVPLTMPASELATAIMALANGLAMERLAEPEAVSDDLFGEMLSLIYEALAARAAALGTGSSSQN
jgi:AcrR family transcriptional regulator